MEGYYGAGSLSRVKLGAAVGKLDQLECGKIASRGES
jgi:hypothetical protein